MKILRLSNFEEFQELYKQYQDKTSDELQNLMLLFVASDAPDSKESWCSDCRNSKPIVDKTIQNFQFNDRLILAIIQVGQREQWKNEDNPYRKHELQVRAVPSLISLKMVSSHFKILGSNQSTHSINNLYFKLNTEQETCGGRMCRCGESITLVFKYHMRTCRIKQIWPAC